ncbi:hypothetical protein FE257_008282 [Aspergillus nanangensis]|uniref:Uncharacterized protein n=1 Tax=Aspergillus nanangensis TaxID=2582783 RepID=A0AAD4GTP3_ASPNN|nr:hypothetical protein FE257_008282 [Aspergillus nanangensis]
MANCGWTMQVVLGASYLVLNAVYMVCALTPSVSRFWHWDLPMLEIENLGAKQADGFAEAVWEAMCRTASTDWAVKGNMAPTTGWWKAWLAEANENLGNPCWDSWEAKLRHMHATVKEDEKDVPASEGVGNTLPMKPFRRQTMLL